MATILNQNDCDALELAIKQVMALSEERREQIEWKLSRCPRVEVGMLASCIMQVTNLRLSASQDPPMELTDEPDELLMQRDFRGSHDAAKLLKQMRALGISDYHPDPMHAIEERKAS